LIYQELRRPAHRHLRSKPRMKIEAQIFNACEQVEELVEPILVQNRAS
jgi:hypothetical protein